MPALKQKPRLRTSVASRAVFAPRRACRFWEARRRVLLPPLGPTSRSQLSKVPDLMPEDEALERSAVGAPSGSREARSAPSHFL